MVLNTIGFRVTSPTEEFHLRSSIAQALFKNIKKSDVEFNQHIIDSSTLTKRVTTCIN